MPQGPQLPLFMQRDGFAPAAALAHARDVEGVARVSVLGMQNAYLVSRHDDVREVLANHEVFHSGLPHGTAPGMFIGMDPPDHTRLRQLLTPEFTGRKVRELEPRIRQIVAGALDDLERSGGPADLVSTFALPVPSLVICELLGVPYADRDAFQERSLRLLDTSLPQEARTASRDEGRAYMGELVARAQAEPGDDLLGMIVRDHRDEVSTEELIGVAELLLLGGHETTSNMLALGTLALLTHPDQLAALRRDSALIDTTVEELLRWLGIVQMIQPRLAVADAEVSGTLIPAGSIVLVSLPAANRDPSFIDDPETLDITRAVSRHIAFGHGIHRCIGAPLGRTEMRIAFPALLERFPQLALAEPDLPPAFRSESLIYGLHELPVTW
jgi:cytochrome P450